MKSRVLRFGCGLLASAVLVCASAGHAAPLTPSAGSAESADGRLKAAPGGVTYTLAGGTRVHFEAGAEYQVGGAMPLDLGQQAKAMSRRFVLHSGSAQLTVPSGSTAVLAQAGGHAGIAAIVAHGTARLAAGTGGMVVETGKGKSLVSHGNAWKVQPEGERRLYSRAQPEGTPITPLPPVSVDPPKPQLAGVGGHATARVSWKSVPGASAYQLQLAPRSGGISRTLVTKQPNIKLSLGVGEHTLRVVALDSWGLPGAESGSTRIRAVGAELPKAARLHPDGRISLWPGQRVALVGHTGMEITYGKFSKHFGAAPASVGLSAGRPVLVRLRERAGAPELSFKLVPNQTEADVRIGPVRATWPKDDLVVSVQLKDPAGVPPGLRTQTRVTVDGRPLALKFKQRGDRAYAHIPRPGFRGKDAGGPWIVRVEVKDEEGRMLGRDFLEVAPTPVKPAAGKSAAGRARLSL